MKANIFIFFAFVIFFQFLTMLASHIDSACCEQQIRCLVSTSSMRRFPRHSTFLLKKGSAIYFLFLFFQFFIHYRTGFYLRLLVFILLPFHSHGWVVRLQFHKIFLPVVYKFELIHKVLIYYVIMLIIVASSWLPYHCVIMFTNVTSSRWARTSLPHNFCSPYLTKMAIVVQ